MLSKKKWMGILFICLALILLTAVFLCVSIAGDPLMAGGVVCISFDKWDMLRADKIIIRYRGETYTVTDPEFVQSFSKETLAGDYSEYCCSDQDDGWVEIYRDDRMLRRMRYIENHGAFAYEADGTHWVLFGDEGHAFLSAELERKLQDIIGA